MRNLLSANFSRLFKNKLFWVLTVVLLAYSVISTCDNASQRAAESELFPNQAPESECFDEGPIVLIMIPVFVSLFLGTEFSDGTMRNKIIVGSRRGQIYLADFITVSAATLAFCAAWHIGSLSVLPILGLWKVGVIGWLLLVLKSVLFCIAFSAILCLVSHIVTNKAAVAVVEIILALAIIMAGSFLYNRLLEPEMISSGVTITADENGNTVMKPIDPHSNPDYVSEPQRGVLKCALNILPSGQAILLANTAYSDIEQLDLPLFSYCASAGLIVLFTAAGLIHFKHKDLK